MKTTGEEQEAGARPAEQPPGDEEPKAGEAEQPGMAPELRWQPEHEGTGCPDNGPLPQQASSQKWRMAGQAAGPPTQPGAWQGAGHDETNRLGMEPQMLREASAHHIFNELDPKGVHLWVLMVHTIPEDPHMEEFLASPAGKDVMVPQPSSSKVKEWKGKLKGKAPVPARKMPAHHVPGAIHEYPLLEEYLATPAGEDVLVPQRAGAKRQVAKTQTTPPIMGPKNPEALEAKRSGKPHHVEMKWAGAEPPPGLPSPPPPPRRGSLRWIKSKLQRTPPPPPMAVSYHRLAFPANKPSTVTSVGSSLLLAWSSSSSSNSDGHRGKPKLTIDATAARLRRAQRLLSRCHSPHALASGAG